MRALLLSIKPKWVAKILNGEKTTEVRKSMPKCDLPIDVYIYCTKDKGLLHKNCADIYWVEDKDFRNKNKKLGLQTQSILNGKVVFKFRCYKVEEITTEKWSPSKEQDLLKESCLTENQLFDYCNLESGKPFYAIRISKLEIFDKPKELSEFKANKKYWCDKCPYQYGICLPKCEELKPLTKAPKSYQFIEGEDK